MQPGACPLDEQALVFALHGPFGPVGAHGREPQERIERETAQRPRMGTDAQIPLREQGMHGQRQHLRPHRGEHRQERMGGIEPHQACGRHHEFGGHVDDLATQRVAADADGARCGCARPCLTLGGSGSSGRPDAGVWLERRCGAALRGVVPGARAPAHSPGRGAGGHSQRRGAPRVPRDVVRPSPDGG